MLRTPCNEMASTKKYWQRIHTLPPLRTENNLTSSNQKTMRPPRLPLSRDTGSSLCERLEDLDDWCLSLSRPPFSFAAPLLRTVATALYTRVDRQPYYGEIINYRALPASSLRAARLLPRQLTEFAGMPESDTQTQIRVVEQITQGIPVSWSVKA